MWERFVLWLCRRIFGMTEYGIYKPPEEPKPRSMIRRPDGSYAVGGIVDEHTARRLADGPRYHDSSIMGLHPDEVAAILPKRLGRRPDGSYGPLSEDKAELRRGIVGGLGCAHEWAPWSEPYTVYRSRRDEVDGQTIEWMDRYQKRRCLHCNTFQEKEVR